MTQPESRYPRTVELSSSRIELRLMTPADEQSVLEFARTLPAHDLLFLRRDITQPKVLSAWIRELEAGTITSLLALREGKLLGCSAVVRDEHSWSPHVGELRVLLSPEQREKGLGRTLIQESFILALSQGLEKLTAQMTADQQAAIAVFEGLGFRAEALLRDHVRDASGAKHDIVILSHDVAEFQAKLQQYGLKEAF
ncbi:MAG: GNAT family protein [Pseudomonadales bacterium]